VPAYVRDITAFEEMFPDPRTLLPQGETGASSVLT